MICWILQYTSICLSQLYNFSTSSLTLYIGDSNLTSSFNKDELDGFCVVDVCGGCEGVSRGVEKIGDSGGSPPPPTLLHLSSLLDESLPSPFFRSS